VYQNNMGLGVRWPALLESETAVLAFGWAELPALQEADLIAVPVRHLYRRGTLIARSTPLRARLRTQLALFNRQDADARSISQDARIRASVGTRTYELVVQRSDRVPQGAVLVPAHLPTGPLTLER
jgi:predicted molibdopterin-dependent oxidoreductase YjgC